MRCNTYELSVEFGQTRLALAVEDQYGVDHVEESGSRESGVWECSGPAVNSSKKEKKNWLITSLATCSWLTSYYLPTYLLVDSSLGGG